MIIKKAKKIASQKSDIHFSYSISGYQYTLNWVTVIFFKPEKSTLGAISLEHLKKYMDISYNSYIKLSFSCAQFIYKDNENAGKITSYRKVMLPWL